jgi:hypothetical protein
MDKQYSASCQNLSTKLHCVRSQNTITLHLPPSDVKHNILVIIVKSCRFTVNRTGNVRISVAIRRVRVTTVAVEKQ